ncbi:MAG: hypothetical protein M1288_04125 [Actinobacteria bacterium]|nr:hypothetical protein [Actinomycetota bacterium]
MSSYLISLDSSRKMKLTYVKVIFALLSRDIALPFTTPDLFMNVTDGVLCH